MSQPSDDPPIFDTIRVAVDGECSTLQLHRPEQLNPLSIHRLDEVEATAWWTGPQHQLKVVVISGAGRAMSSGADLAGFGGFGGSPTSREDSDQGGRTARAIEQMRAVTIAQIHGWCVGVLRPRIGMPAPRG